ncbi:MAG: FG-GAP repeat protein, partial [Acidimicrobiales bacterium]
MSNIGQSTSRASRIVIATLLAVAATVITLAPANAAPGPPTPGPTPAPPPGPVIPTILGKLTADDAFAEDLFGQVIAVDGDTVVVGAYADDDGGPSSGSAYVFTRSGLSWTQQAKLTASDAAPGDIFGITVAILGDTILVGAYGDDDRGADSGSVYVFTRSGTNWSERTKLTAADGAAADSFGSALGIDGGTAVVGAFHDDNDGINSGSAYVFVGSGASWTQQAKLTAADGAANDFFGRGVDILGDSVVVGAFGDDDAGLTSGSAYVFTRAGTIWSQQTKLTASDAAASDDFGRSVAMSGNTVVVGSSGDASNAGSAYVFTRASSVWSQQSKLTASDQTMGDLFGWAVAISRESIVVGAWGDDDDALTSGSAYVFTRTGTAWSQKEKLTASDAGAEDRFGSSVTIDGITIGAGALLDDDDGSNSGS